jgi:hypothetical protein
MQTLTPTQGHQELQAACQRKFCILLGGCTTGNRAIEGIVEIMGTPGIGEIAGTVGTYNVLADASGVASVAHKRFRKSELSHISL